MAELFGFEINRKVKEPVRPSFVPDTEAEGTGVISTGGHFGQYRERQWHRADQSEYGEHSTAQHCKRTIEHYRV